MGRSAMIPDDEEESSTLHEARQTDWRIYLSLLFGSLCVVAILSLGAATRPKWQGAGPWMAAADAAGRVQIKRRPLGPTGGSANKSRPAFPADLDAGLLSRWTRTRHWRARYAALLHPEEKAPSTPAASRDQQPSAAGRASAAAKAASAAAAAARAAASATARPKAAAAAEAAANQPSARPAATKPAEAAAVAADQRSDAPWQDLLRLPWQPLLRQQDVQRGLSYYGTGSRMRRLATKLLAGRPIKAYTLGGSVTAGQGASRPAANFVSRFFQFINATFPHRWTKKQL